MVITLMRMFMAGPEGSLKGSSTVSPTPAALWGFPTLPPGRPQAAQANAIGKDCFSIETADEVARKDQADDGHHRDEDVHGGARGVLEGVADGVADHGRLVGLSTLAAVGTSLDVLLGVVPGTARVGHEDGEAEADDQRTGEEAEIGRAHV